VSAEWPLPEIALERVAATVEAERLIVANRDPVPDEVAVPLWPVITFRVFDLGVSRPDLAQTRVWVDGQLAFDLIAAPAFANSDFYYDVDADSLAIWLRRNTPFASQQAVEVRVETRTLDGGASLEATWSFGSEDRTAPTPVSAVATSTTSVRVSFNEDIRVPANLATLTLEPLSAPAVGAGVASARALGTALLIDVSPPLTPGARYRLRLTGVTDISGNPVLAPADMVEFDAFRPPQPATRRFDLWTMLPAYARRMDETGDLARFIACLQELVDGLLVDIDRFVEIADIERAPAAFVDLLLADLGNPFHFDLDTLGKRRLGAVLVQMYQQKGTAIGIRNAVRFFVGVEVSAITPYAAVGFELGEAELGVDWVLSPSGRFARYAFDVHVAVVLTTEQRRRIRALVEYLKPAHTHFIELVEPTLVLEAGDWLLGVSEVGDRSVLAG
jgi:phage tail-like protein